MAFKNAPIRKASIDIFNSMLSINFNRLYKILSDICCFIFMDMRYCDTIIVQEEIMQDIRIRQVYRPKTGELELYEVCAFHLDAAGQLHEIAVTRIQDSHLSIKVDALVNALNFDLEIKNTILEELFSKKYGENWRTERKGILWFSLEYFKLNFTFYKEQLY